MFRRSSQRSRSKSSRHGNRVAPRLEGLEDRLAPAVIHVTDLGDSGPGTFRQALLDANAASGSVAIAFDVVGTINVLSQLPSLSDATGGTFIRGDQNPAYAGVPVIKLQGPGAGAPMNGLQVTSAHNEIRGLQISGFTSGIEMRGPGATSNTVTGCFLGNDGSVSAPNTTGMTIVQGAHDNIVGGTAANLGNVISGNTLDGILISEAGADDNIVIGNKIGTTPDGLAALGNANIGIRINGGASGNRIGTDGNGVNDAAESNIISGNFFAMSIEGGTTAFNKVAGNYIGLDATGSAALPNTLGGISIHVDAHHNTIGGPSAVLRNLIAGNAGSGPQVGNGVFIHEADFNVVQNNFIGTDATGTLDLGNAGNGILITTNAQGNEVRSNNISGNGAFGIEIHSGTTFTTLDNNQIGVGATFAPLGNSAGGVRIASGSSNHLVANQIGFNAGPGVEILNGSANRLEANAIFGNAGLGINLAVPGDPAGGVTSNDADDADAGPNGLQNFPTLANAFADGTHVFINGSLQSAPDSAYTMEFFASISADPTGFGEGLTYIGSAQVHTNFEGKALFTLTLASSITSFQVITATATDAAGNTSEFSAAVPLHLVPPPPTLRIDDIAVLEGNSGISEAAVFTLTLSHASHQPINITFSTADGTAKGVSPGQASQGEYTPFDDSVMFFPGETTKTVTVNIYGDPVFEPDETFFLNLSLTQGQLANGSDGQAMCTVVNDDPPPPTVSISDVTVTEGNSGFTQAVFTISLSHGNHQGINISHVTGDVTATGVFPLHASEGDYTPFEDSFSIAPGQTSKTLVIDVYGDSQFEPDETFLVDIGISGGGATIADGRAVGTILNDDFTWTGGGSSSSWSDAGNWGGAKPKAGAHLVFGPGAPGHSINDLPTDTEIASITITGGDYFITGNRIKLGAGGITVTGGDAYIEQDNAIDPIDLPIAVAAGSRLTLAGRLSGDGIVEKTSEGILVLSGANSYTGQTRVMEGVLRIENSLALGLSAAGTELQGAAVLELAGGITVAGETLAFKDASATPEGIRSLEDDINAIRSVSGDNAWTGGWAIEPICLPIVVEAGSTFTASGVLSGVGGLHKDGLGTFVLSGANTYDGVTHVAEGVLRLENSMALGTTAMGTELIGGSLELKGGISVADGLQALEDDINAIRSVSGDNAWTGAWSIDPICLPIVVESGSLFDMSGVIDGVGGIHKEGTGKLVLSGDNTYAGVTHVTEGIVNIRSNTAFGATGGITELIGGATLELEGGITVDEVLIAVGDPPGTKFPGVKLVNLSGVNIINEHRSINPLLEISIPSGTLTITSEIAGNDDIVVDGPGTLILTADNDELNGTITLKSGTLLVNGSWAAVPIIVQGGILGGTGVLGPITLQGGLIQGAVIQASPLDSSLRDLVVGGTEANDDIDFTPGAAAGTVEVVLNGVSQGVFAPTGRLIAYGSAGNDDLEAAGSLSRSAWLYGGAGHDRLKGGAGGDVLVGGDGDDLIVGGSGRDLMIGGFGSDRLIGNADDDIMIAGITAFDDDVSALGAIMTEWTRTDQTYAQRVDHLQNGGGLSGAALLQADGPHRTVFDDGAVDQLTGSSGKDWFFANLEGGVLDTITDLHGQEFADELA